MSTEYIKDWEQSDIPFDTCRRCEHGEYVVDPYGTGDSPSGVECNAQDEKQCPYMEQFEIDVTKLENIQLDDVYIADHPDYADAYVLSAEYRGEQLNDYQLEFVNDSHPEIAQELAYESLL